MLPAISTADSAINGLTAPAAAGSSSSLTSQISPGGGSGQGTPFSDLLTDAVGQVDELESQARGAVSGLMTGNGVDVHEAMIATQKADMAFEMALAVRNKAVQAYQQVMSMQF